MLSNEKEIALEASLEKLDILTGFVEELLEAAGCPAKFVTQTMLCIEEIFANVASYAYAPETGLCNIKIRTEWDGASGRAAITVTDSGTPFNPLLHQEPDITLGAEERQIGGLGILMVKRSMDSVDYEYADGKNILTLKKSWDG